MKFQRELVNFLDMMSGEQVVSINTRDAYKGDLESLFAYLNSLQIKLDEVSEQCLQGYISSLVAAGLKASSVARKVAAIRSFFRFLSAEGELVVNPAVDLIVPKLVKPLPKALVESDVKKIVEYDWKPGTIEGIRAAAIVQILYASGLRVSELVSLKIQTLQFSPDQRLLPHFIVKGKGRKERMVMLYDKVLLAFQNYFDIKNKFVAKGIKTDWIFPSMTKDGAITHLSRQRVGQILKEMASECGLDPCFVSPHKLRHSFASHLLHNGANLRVVQELLGHADISSTQIYTKVRNSDAIDLVLNKHPLANG
jgi:integrase/recombinase XerD